MGMDDQSLHTISSFQPGPISSENSKVEPQKASILTMLLIKLAGHYHRPDMSEGQLKGVVRDMVEDLAEFAIHDVEQAIRSYRCNSKNRFFPNSGQLRDLAAESRTERHQTATARSTAAFMGQQVKSRPMLWWLKPRKLWEPEWRVSEISDNERMGYDRWIAAIKSGKVAGKNPNDY